MREFNDITKLSDSEIREYAQSLRVQSEIFGLTVSSYDMLNSILDAAALGITNLDDNYVIMKAAIMSAIEGGLELRVAVHLVASPKSTNEGD
jgi:hypothetical protein